jgi:hypothetical protein
MNGVGRIIEEGNRLEKGQKLREGGDEKSRAREDGQKEIDLT